MTISISALPAARAIAEFFAVTPISAAHPDCDANCLYCWGPETD
ncbi:MAG: hypothetical protein ABWZ98_08670 [Nakamurella sp.]